MITIRKIFLFVVLILFFACSEEKKMKEKGNLIVSKIENPKPSPPLRSAEFPNSAASTDGSLQLPLSQSDKTSHH